jgi:CHAT domain-containing protein/TolA-binding protein
VGASTDEIHTQLARATALRKAGQLSEAHKIYESLLPGLRAQPGKELGEALIGLSQIANAQGKYDAAVALARESVGIYHQLGDKDGEARARNDAGFALMNAGDYREAARELDLALQLNRQDGTAETAMFILNNLGSVYYYQAKYTEAFAAYDDAMQRLEHSGSAPWAPYWRKATLFNLAVLYQRLGDEQRALSVYRELQQSPSGLANRDLGLLYANLGVLYRHLGDPQKALDAYQTAERYYEIQHDTEGELGVKMDIGILLAFDLDRLDQALKVFTEIRTRAEKIKSQREAMQALLYRAQTLYRAGHFLEAKIQFASALAEAEKLGTTEEQWKALYSLGRIAEKENQSGPAEARYRDAIARIESVRSKIQLSRLRSGFLADKRDVYDALIKLLVLRNDPAAAFEYMERSRARVFQDRFFTGQARPAAVSLGSIQARLGPSTALVEFWVSADMMAAVWITKNSVGLVQRQVSPQEMETLSRIITHLPDGLLENWQADFARLNALLPQHIEPLSDARYTHLLIVPDGFMSLVPFELVTTDAGTLLLETHDLTYLPSAVLLLRGPSAQEDRIRFPWERQLIAFGDPMVRAAGADSIVALNSEGAGLLPGAADEIRRIERMSNGRATIFLGAADQKKSFIDASRLSPALLHLSTHAVTDLDNPERSRLMFSPGESEQRNDFLFLKELYDLNLQGVNMVVLSACDTERGRMIPGEGIQSFSRALLASGSRSALTTLWRVPDQPTAEFVKQFYYFLLRKHKSKAEALRLAKLEFLNSSGTLRYPRYWAAFVLNGEGEKPVPSFLAWQTVLLPIPLAVLLTVVTWHFWQRRGTQRSSKIGSNFTGESSFQPTGHSSACCHNHGRDGPG